MEGTAGVGATGEGSTAQNTGVDNTQATETQTEYTEGVVDDNTASEDIESFIDFDMFEEGEQSEGGEDGEDAGEGLELLTYEGEEYSEEEMAEISEYGKLAKELGLDPLQYNILFRTVQLNRNKQIVAEIEGKLAQEREGLQNLKKELSLEERTAWQPMARQLVSEYGEETAKAIMTNPNIYRAFLGRNKGLQNDVNIRKNQGAKLGLEQALEARTKELQENLGNGKKTIEILERYEKEYPDFFPKKNN